MALAYTEFDTTQANLLTDLRTYILASTDWSRPNSATEPDTYSCTTTRGAKMVFDLADAALTMNMMTIGVWKDYDGTTFTDKTQRYLFFRTNVTGAVATMPLHCIVSAGKEHIYISVEGPRPNETGVSNGNYGSVKHSFFMCDLVPYHAGDTIPVVFAGGSMANVIGASLANNSNQGNLSRNYSDTGSWAVAKPATLDFPTQHSAETINYTRQAIWDNKLYLAPYVIFEEGAGIRGRLSSFFFAGYNSSDTPEAPVPLVNSKVNYGGQTYKLLSVVKNDSTAQLCWNQFGSVTNNSTATYWRSPIVAVPCTP